MPESTLITIMHSISTIKTFQVTAYHLFTYIYDTLSLHRKFHEGGGHGITTSNISYLSLPLTTFNPLTTNSPLEYWSTLLIHFTDGFFITFFSPVLVHTLSSQSHSSSFSVHIQPCSRYHASFIQPMQPLLQFVNLSASLFNTLSFYWSTYWPHLNTLCHIPALIIYLNSHIHSSHCVQTSSE